jgi:hypothetical protein
MDSGLPIPSLALTVAPQAPLEPRRASVGAQLTSGFFGYAIGAGLGLVLSGVLKTSHEPNILPFLLGGAVVGTTVSVHSYGQRRGMRGSWPLTFLGATGGLVLLPISFVTSPALATWAYRASADDAAPQDPPSSY